MPNSSKVRNKRKKIFATITIILAVLALLAALPSTILDGVKLWDYWSSDTAREVLITVNEPVDFKKSIDHLQPIISGMRPRILALPFNFNNISRKYNYLELSKLSAFGLVKINEVLVESDQVSVIHRQELDPLLREIRFSHTGLVSSEQSLRFGRMLSASFLLQGSVDELSYFTHRFNDFGVNIKTRIITVRISITLINTESTEILFVKSVRKEEKELLASGESERQKDFKLFRNAITKIVREIKKPLKLTLSKMGKQ